MQARQTGGKDKRTKKWKIGRNDVFNVFDEEQLSVWMEFLAKSIMEQRRVEKHWNFGISP